MKNKKYEGSVDIESKMPSITNKLDNDAATSSINNEKRYNLPTHNMIYYTWVKIM